MPLSEIPGTAVRVWELRQGSCDTGALREVTAEQDVVFKGQTLTEK